MSPRKSPLARIPKAAAKDDTTPAPPEPTATQQTPPSATPTSSEAPPAAPSVMDEAWRALLEADTGAAPHERDWGFNDRS